MQIQNALLTGSTTVYGPITFVSGSIIGSSSYAATSSYADTFTVAGSLTAQTLVVQTITSSVSFITGSTRFGSLLTNTHTFTGSLQVTGSGPHTVFGNVQVGNNTSVSTATPVIMSLGGTFSNTAGANVKLRVYEDGVGGSIGGMSVSSGQMEVNTWSSGRIAFYRGTTQTAVFDAGGSLGIGTATPLSRLHVETSSVSNGNILTLRNSAVWSTPMMTSIAIKDSNADVGAIGWRYNSSGGTVDMHIHSLYNNAYTNINNIVMTVRGNGNVGIGTVLPTALLQVSGSNSGSLMQISSHASSNIFFVSGSGNVGIGTATPTERLDVIGGAVAAGNGTIRTGITYSSLGLIGTFTNHDLGVITNGSERMRISAAGTASFTGNSLTSAADAATINLKQNSTTANTGIYLERSGEQKGYYIYMGGSLDSLTFRRNNAGTKEDVMSLTRDGSVGIGTTPSAWGTVFTKSAIQFGGSVGVGVLWTNSFNNGVFLGNNLYDDGAGNARYIINGTSTQYVQAGGEHYWSNASSGTAGNVAAFTERMRITSGGKLLIGTTSAGYGLFTEQRMTLNPTNDGITVAPLTQNKSAYTLQADNNTGNRYAVYVANGSSAEVGSMSFTSTAVAFNTTSDYRLKQDFKDFKGLDLISSIKTYDFEWKINGSRSYGVIAHELQEVIPYVVINEKDGSKFQSVDYSKLVPILVKSIQELSTKLEEATTRIKTLESR